MRIVEINREPILANRWQRIARTTDNPELENARAQPRRRPVGQLDDPNPSVGTGAQRDFDAERLSRRLVRRHRLDGMACKDGLAIHLFHAIGLHSSNPHPQFGRPRGRAKLHLIFCAMLARPRRSRRVSHRLIGRRGRRPAARRRSEPQRLSRGMSRPRREIPSLSLQQWNITAGGWFGARRLPRRHRGPSR
ncbi:hypothetical protein MPL3356_70304 [Mesorhizobium plurifarium]|uniref:Uncharacterized protein n=1 Tax=Mesorhizobium plurifarium TaxID=69974 RepID=A0A090GCJ6_MESPL|nr:hypothetical protein MPL3356_70304 [Mesorhizobium plurifarium]CDX62360.1 hypothetical protein MPL3365_70423 [Mesorhizobium plurifarium]